MKFELEYIGNTYIVEDTFERPEIVKDEVPFMWAEGNFSCDCNKSIFINDQCDSSFPILECGEEIKLIRRIE